MTDAPPLAGTAFDRATDRRTDPVWLAQAWERARVVMVDAVNVGQLLLRADVEPPALALLPAEEVPLVAEPVRLFLGLDPDGTPLFAVDAPLPDLPGTRVVGLREVGHRLSDRDVALATTAVALANWHAGHAYSPRTGRPTVADEGGWSRVDEGGQRMWPRTDPAMIVLVHDGVAGPDGRCLLGSNANWPSRPDRRRFSCLAGYVEPGESAEAAVVREVREEVGVEVGRVTYAGSQAWPFPGSLMLGFLAVADAAQPLRLDPTEIAYARWFSRGEIAAALAGEPVDTGEGAGLVLPPPLSIALYLIRRWLSG